MTTEVEALQKAIKKVTNYLEKGAVKDMTPLELHSNTLGEANYLFKMLLDKNRTGSKIAIGNIIISLIAQAEKQGTTIEECLLLSSELLDKSLGDIMREHFERNIG